MCVSTGQLTINHALWEKGKLRECVCVCVSGEDGVVGALVKKGGLTGAHVEFGAAHAVVSGRTVVETLPVLPHPLPPQKQEELGLAVYTAVVPGAHRAALADGVRAIARCRTDTGEKRSKGD